MGCFFVSAHNFPPQSNVFWNILRHTKTFLLKIPQAGSDSHITSRLLIFHL